MSPRIAGPLARQEGARMVAVGHHYGWRRPGQEPSRLPSPKNPIKLDRFILDGMKEDTIVIFMGDNGKALPPFRFPIFVSQRAKDI